VGQNQGNKDEVSEFDLVNVDLLSTAATRIIGKSSGRSGERKLPLRFGGKFLVVVWMNNNRGSLRGRIINGRTRFIA
jgi:hypothetical protein